MKMIAAAEKPRTNRAAITYEVLVWLLYVSFFKYAKMVDNGLITIKLRENFPYPQLCLFAIGLTLYVIPYYRWLGPKLLDKKRYVSLFFMTILFFFFFSKLCNWGITALFYHYDDTPALAKLYSAYYGFFSRVLVPSTADLPTVFTDILAFVSVMFVRYAFDNERKKHQLEKDNLMLQLGTLKAQLQPHFLFNTLNSIYGMSITGSKDTPEFILRLSDMMRYILYDCKQNQVPVEKDIEFLENYFAMEKKRYPGADIDFTITNTSGESVLIAPLLFIPFVENSFKHGAHRLNDKGFIKGELVITDRQLHLKLANDVFHTAAPRDTYGGVGIENVQQRLQLYYPKSHRLDIVSDTAIFTVNLVIDLNRNTK